MSDRTGAQIPSDSCNCESNSPDDKMMLLQLRTHEENMQTSCKQAEDLKQKEYLSSAASSKKTSASRTAADSIASATKTSRAPNSKTSSEAPAATGGSAAQASSPTAAISLLPFVSDGSRSDFDDWMGLLILWTLGAWFF